MIDAFKKWAPWIIVSVAILGVASLTRPTSPATDWPQASPQAREFMAQRLAVAASEAWQQGHASDAWQAAQVLHEAFPESPQAVRVAPHLTRLEEAASRQVSADKWQYEVMEGSGWGRLAEAQLAAEPLSFSPDIPASFLLVRQATNARYQAAFFVPGMAMPDACHAPSGCLVWVGKTETPSAQRIRPVEGQPGWWEFSDFSSLVSLLGKPQGLELRVSRDVQEPLRFDSSGLSRARLGLPAYR